MNESQNSINKMSYLRFALDKFWERILSGGANTLKNDGKTKKRSSYPHHNHQLHTIPIHKGELSGVTYKG